MRKRIEVISLEPLIKMESAKGLAYRWDSELSVSMDNSSIQAPPIRYGTFANGGSFQKLTFSLFVFFSAVN